MAEVNDETIKFIIDELTPKEQLYVQARAQGLGKKPASRAAGFADETEGRTVEKRERVQDAIRMLRAESVEKSRVTRDDIEQGFLDAVRAAATATELVMAWRELGKFRGLYEPERKEIKIDARLEGKVKHIQTLSDAELAKLAGFDAKMIAIDGECERIN